MLTGINKTKIVDGNIYTNKVFTIKDINNFLLEQFGQGYCVESNKEFFTKKDCIPVKCSKHGVNFKTIVQLKYQKYACKKCSVEGGHKKQKIKVATLWKRIKTKGYEQKYVYKNISEIKGLTDNLVVECPIHGEFITTVESHLHTKYGCPKCSQRNSNKKKSMQMIQFIEKSKNIHKNKFSYELLNSANFNKGLKHITGDIICKEHGKFRVNLHEHLSYKFGGCKKCNKLYKTTIKLDRQKWINKCSVIHDKKYNYDLVSESFSQHDKVTIICPLHGAFKKSAYVHYSQGCPKCSKELTNAGKSKKEEQLFKFISTIYKGAIERNVKFNCEGHNREIDIYLPEKQLGIEFNGIYWHSELKKKRNYHQEKMILLQKKGIRLIQIFENEWVNPLTKTIIKSILNNVLGNCNNKYYARKCQIKNVSFNEYREFLKMNHLQGVAPASIIKGLFVKNELVSLMSFGKNRYKKDNSLELIRFCNKLNSVVVGGFSKLLTHVIEEHKQYDTITTFCDLRFFQSKTYIERGFEIQYITKPNYFYVKRTNLNKFSRVSCMKHKIKDKFNFFDAEKTESENMLLNGFYRIFDAGNVKLQLKTQLYLR